MTRTKNTDLPEQYVTISDLIYKIEKIVDKGNTDIYMPGKNRPVAVASILGWIESELRHDLRCAFDLSKGKPSEELITTQADDPKICQFEFAPDLNLRAVYFNRQYYLETPPAGAIAQWAIATIKEQGSLKQRYSDKKKATDRPADSSTAPDGAKAVEDTLSYEDFVTMKSHGIGEIAGMLGISVPALHESDIYRAYNRRDNRRHEYDLGREYRDLSLNCHDIIVRSEGSERNVAKVHATPKDIAALAAYFHRRPPEREREEFIPKQELREQIQASHGGNGAADKRTHLERVKQRERIDKAFDDCWDQLCAAPKQPGKPIKVHKVAFDVRFETRGSKEVMWFPKADVEKFQELMAKVAQQQETERSDIAPEAIRSAAATSAAGLLRR